MMTAVQHITRVQSGSTSIVLTNLLLTAWRLDPIGGTIVALADSGSEAGTAAAVALSSTVTTDGTPLILASMRRGTGDLQLIAFELVFDTLGRASIVRTGDFWREAGTDVTQTTLAA